MSVDRIRKAAAFLEIDAAPLLQAADSDRGYAELNVENLPEPGREFAAQLARDLPELEPSEFEQLRKFLEELRNR